SVNGDDYNMLVPPNIVPGQYMIRHEIIALHEAVNGGNAQFYPVCIQIDIGGRGSGVPNETVHFPGAYHATDPGVEVDNVRALWDHDVLRNFDATLFSLRCMTEEFLVPSQALRL
ncbi:glycosyl hydrolase family 61-domain-containing protein, partial [Trametes elegans]